MDESLRALIEPVVESCGFELWDLGFSRSGGRAVLQVLIDGPNGVGLDDCRDVSTRVAEALDEADPIPGEFTLEVASPGIERTLRHRGDIERFEGSLARVATRSPIDGLLQHDGRLAGVEGGVARLRLASGELRAIPLGAIRKAHLLYDPDAERPAAAARPSARGTRRA